MPFTPGDLETLKHYDEGEWRIWVAGEFSRSRAVMREELDNIKSALAENDIRWTKQRKLWWGAICILGTLVVQRFGIFILERLGM